MIIPLALLVAFTPLAPAAASVQEEGLPASDGLRILVVAPAANADRVEEIYSGLRAAGLQPVDLDERAGVDRQGAPPPRLGAREEARAHLQEAKASFRNLDLEGTRAACEATIDEILRLEHPEESMETLADALLVRANAALVSGSDDDARQALVLLARLEPERRELHPGLHPPSLVQAYAAAREDAQARPAGSIVMRPRVASFGTPELCVDGRPATATSSLRAGPHLITVRAPGTMPFSRIVELNAEPLVLEPFLAPADAPERRERLVDTARRATVDSDRVEALDAIAQLCAARAVLYVDTAVALLFVPGRPLFRLRAAPTADGALLGRATLAVLQAPALIGEIGSPAPQPIDVVSVVGVSAVGLVVLGGAVAGALYALPLLPSAAPKRLPPAPVVIGCCVD